MSEKKTFTRREFLLSAAIASAGLTIPYFLTRSVGVELEDNPEAKVLPGFKDGAKTSPDGRASLDLISEQAPCLDDGRGVACRLLGDRGLPASGRS